MQKLEKVQEEKTMDVTPSDKYRVIRIKKVDMSPGPPYYPSIHKILLCRDDSGTFISMDPRVSRQYVDKEYASNF